MGVKFARQASRLWNREGFCLCLRLFSGVGIVEVCDAFGNGPLRNRPD